MNIFLVEDNPGDVRLVSEFFREFHIVHEMQNATDGDEAITYLSSINNKSALPDIIFLDINLPKKNGFEILDFIKDHKKLKTIPTIILSSSDDPYEKQYSAQRGAAAYIEKPLNLNDFFVVLRSIDRFEIKISFPGK